MLCLWGMGVPGGSGSQVGVLLEPGSSTCPFLSSHGYMEKDAPFYRDPPGKSLSISYQRQRPSAKGQGAMMEQGG